MEHALTIRSIEHEPRPEILASKVLHGLQIKRVLQVIRGCLTDIPRCTYATSKHCAMMQARVQIFKDPRDKVPLSDPVRAQMPESRPSFQLSNGPYSACTMQRRPPYTITAFSLVSFLTHAPATCFADPC